MPRILPATFMAFLAAAGVARASTVEFRIVERRGQTSWTGIAGGPTDDNIFNFAVQARVLGGSAGESIGFFDFNITSNEPTSAGTLSRSNISNVDGTYNTGATQYNNTSSGSVSGVAAIYRFFVGLSLSFNGLINISSGSYIEDPLVQDIGLVRGAPMGGPLLLLADPLMTGNPATYPGAGTSAPLDAALATGYLGANGNFVDLYHFNYTRSFASVHPMTFSLTNVSATTFTSLSNDNGDHLWGPAQGFTPTGIISTPITLALTPAPGTAVLVAASAALLTVRRRRQA